jgi:hypothetical protein
MLLHLRKCTNNSDNRNNSLFIVMRSCTTILYTVKLRVRLLLTLSQTSFLPVIAVQNLTREDTFSFSVFWGGVRLSPLGTSATI